jgi:tetratricopeptide (TPR) repeat protein
MVNLAYVRDVVPYNESTRKENFTKMRWGVTGVFLLLSARLGNAQLEKAIELQKQGRAQEALTIFEHDIPLLRTSGDQSRLAQALSAAGEACVSSGKYQAALTYSKESLALHQSLKDSPAQARDWNALGLADMYLGNYTPALSEFREALVLDRANRDREGEIARLDNLGNVYYFQGRYLDALQSFSSALAKVNAAAGEKWSVRRRQLTVANLATLYQRIGAEEKALALYSEFRENPNAMRPSEVAQMLLNQGVLYRRLGDPVKALEMYRSAQGLFAKDQHRDGEIGALRNIGIALGLDMQDLPGALKVFGAALKLAREAGSNRGEVQAELYSGEILRRMYRLDEAATALDRAAAGAKRAGLVEEQWKALYSVGLLADARGESARAASCFAEAIRLIETVRAGLQLTALRTDFLADKRDVYDALVALRLKTGRLEPEPLLQLIERSRARTLQDRIAGTRQVSLPAIQAQLDPSTLLIEYWIGQDAAAAIWIKQGSAGVVKKDFEHDAGIAALTESLSQGSSSWRALSAAVGGQLLGGLPFDGQARHLIIVPDGPLQALPFEILQLPDTGTFVVEKFDVSYLPAAALALNAKPRRRGWLFPWQREMVAIGDPVSGRETIPENPLAAGEQWLPLPRAAEEIRAISKIVNGRTEQHLAADARKAYLTGSRLELLPLLHFSTHASADMQDPERSRILLAPPEQNAPFDFLFLREIYGLDLKGVDLVTVSACDTERGKLVRGEGAQGFSRAFLAAGAAASVTSLWRVTDASTAELMKQFYFALSSGESKAEALRTAKLKFLRSGSKLDHPRYWAAFVLSGDGRSPIVRVISWSVIVAVAAVLLLGFGIIVTRRQVSASRAKV